MSLFELEPGRLYRITFERQYPVRGGEAAAGEGQYVHKAWYPYLQTHVLTPAEGGPDIELHPEDIKDVH